MRFGKVPTTEPSSPPWDRDHHRDRTSHRKHRAPSTSVRTKKVAKVMPRGSRYGPFLSVGNLLGVSAPGLSDAVKVQFLPQWETYRGGAVEAVLSKRFLMIDLGVSEMTRADLAGIDVLAENLSMAVRAQPDAILQIANAFGPSGSREDRESIPWRAGELRLAQEGRDPTAFWGLLLVGAAILVASCCNKTDTDCGSNGTDTDDDKGAGGTDGGTDTD